MAFSFWQSLARQDPLAAAHEVLHRSAALPPAQQTAIWAIPPTADALAARIAETRNGPLGGIPYALKDLFHVAGLPTRGSGNLPPELFPPASADGHLARALTTAGAALAGKTHLHEFAYGLTGENPHHGDVEHPRFPGRTSGGSSSGSAAAVASGVVPLSLGTDTGGSIRVPAAFCGLYGLRLTPGDAWMSDGFPLAPSFDTVGWMTSTAADMLATLNALLPSTPPPSAATMRPARGLFLPAESVGVTGEAGVAAAIAAAVHDWAPPAPPEVAREFTAAHIAGATTYSVLQSTEALAVHAAWLDLHRDRYGENVWRLIDRGRHWTDAQRAAAAFSLAAVRRFWTQFFLAYDFLVLPATPFPALTKAECTPANRARLLALTAPASLAGLPVLTVPVALPGGLSSGMQVIVNHCRSPVLHQVLRRCATC